MKKNLLFIPAMILLIVSSVYSQVTFSTGAMDVYVGQYGKLRLFTPDGTKHLQLSAILVGTSATAVFDHENDAEVVTATAAVTTPALSDFETTGTYDNSYSGAPPAVSVDVNAYGWTNAAYTVVKYTVKNNETSAIDASIGLEILPNINATYGYDTVTYNNAEGVIRFHRGLVENMGIKLLSTTLSSVFSFEWYDGYQVDADFWTWMNKGSLQSEYISTTVEGPVAITSQAPVTIAPGESATVFYAYALGADEQTMLSNIAEAKLKYDGLVTSIKEPPTSAKALRNYPNPVKSTTKISYQLPKEGFVTLKVYDALGKEAATIVNSKQSGGTHTIDFSSEGLSRGVYSYKLIFNNQVTTSKMIVVK
jgi:hypothetical protein